MILDTNAVSAWLAGDAALKRLFSQGELTHLPVIVIGEYLFGLLRSTQAAKLRQGLADLQSESIILPVELETASCYADIKEELRRNGRPIPQNDIWISALARQHNLEVISRDTHFDFVLNLIRKGW